MRAFTGLHARRALHLYGEVGVSRLYKDHYLQALTRTRGACAEHCHDVARQPHCMVSTQQRDTWSKGKPWQCTRRLAAGG